MTVIPPTEDQLRGIYRQLNMTPEGVEQDVKYLREWISQQPHLPTGIDERWLRNSLIFRKNSLEKVKESIDLFYSAKVHVPELLSDRDPLNPDLQRYLDNLMAFPFPRLTPECSRVVLFRLLSGDTNLFHFETLCKLTLMFSNMVLLEDKCLNTTIIIDMAGITMRHMAHIPLTTAAKFMFIAQKAFPIRQKQAHVINAPPYVDTMFKVFKPLIKKKLVDRVHLHVGGLGNIFDMVPREIFPKDYGGDEISLAELHEQWKQRLVKFRDWLLQDDLLQVDERKRPGKPKTHNDLFGFDGSFRQLNVD